MQQYFVDKIEDNQALITDQDAHHIKNVMRGKLGDFIRVCSGDTCFKATILELAKTHVLVRVNEPFPSTELGINVDIAQSLIKREKFELMIQKSSELGVRNILPIKAKHSVVKINDSKMDSKLKRWNLIAKEASEQSERSRKVKVESPKSIKEVNFELYDTVFVLYAREDENQLQINLNNINNVCIVIGPEGGFSKEELDYLSTLPNTKIISLGDRILRSETASLYMLSVLGYLDGVK